MCIFSKEKMYLNFLFLLTRVRELREESVPIFWYDLLIPQLYVLLGFQFICFPKFIFGPEETRSWKRISEMKYFYLERKKNARWTGGDYPKRFLPAKNANPTIRMFAYASLSKSMRMGKFVFNFTCFFFFHVDREKCIINFLT